jgi:hypothetical protein
MFFKDKISTKLLILQLVAIILVFFANQRSYATPQVAYEYQVKAVFLYNFANFIRWPSSAFANRYAPFRICIIGDDPFREELDITVENEKIGRHSVEVKRLNTMIKIHTCQILFVSQSKQAYVSNILTYIQQYPILTVSDIDDFAIKGGMIQFYKHGKRIRFYINPDSLKKVGLHASANLLRLARLVRTRH